MATWQPPRAPARRHRLSDLRAVRVAALLASALLVGGLIVRGSLGLSSAEPEHVVRVDPASGVVLSGGAALSSDTAQPLFSGVVLAPGDGVEACIRIDYAGDVDPDAVAMYVASVHGDDALARRLSVAIDRGLATGASATCEGFVAAHRVADGRFADLAARADGAASGWRGWDPAAGTSSAWYRVTVALDAGAPDHIQGLRVDADFAWSAVAPDARTSALARLLIVAASVARDAVLPMLLLVAVAVLFLGIQDRIDRRDPKLALAPVTNHPLHFEDDAAVTPQPVRSGGSR